MNFKQPFSSKVLSLNLSQIPWIPDLDSWCSRRNLKGQIISINAVFDFSFWSLIFSLEFWFYYTWDRWNKVQTFRMKTSTTILIQSNSVPLQRKERFQFYQIYKFFPILKPSCTCRYESVTILHILEISWRNTGPPRENIPRSFS